MTDDCRGWFDDRISEALGGDENFRPKIEFDGDFRLSSVAHVSGLALATMTAAARQLAMLTGAERMTVNRRRAELWCDMTLRPEGWTLPGSWDPVAGNYRARDGWVRLHTNVPAHLASALQVLGTEADRNTVTRAVANWDRFDLEQAVVEAGGVAAAMIGIEDWAVHPQGRAVAAEPLIHWQAYPGAAPRLPAFDQTLQGLRVLDLTRVLAGPVATRFLAGFGASVLRVDPPDWREDGLEPEVTLGKACTGLDLRQQGDRDRFEKLLAQAHVLVHGYRPGALDRLGYGQDRRRAINPDLIDVSLNAYGWTGPWRDRRGFDSVVQVNAGFAQEGMERTGADKPVALPVQVLDHGTSYLMAAAVLYALRMQRQDGRARAARLSLARTAHLLASAGVQDPPAALPQGDAVDWQDEATHWGPARRVAFPVTLQGNGPVWRHPAAPFRSAPAEWP